MKRSVVCYLLLILGLCASSFAISIEEEQALIGLIERWPALETEYSFSNWNKSEVELACDSEWYGLGCTNHTITALSFSGSYFSGPIPVAQLSNLANLTHLAIRDCAINNVIPKELATLSKLTHLVLHDSGLNGTVPVELGSLTRLQTLDLSSNKLQGSLPSSLANLVDLYSLDIGGNQITELPSELGKLTNLQYFNFGWNNITTLPSLANSTRLFTLIGASNKLTGSFPSFITQLPNLEYLFLPDNQMSGTLPESLNSISSMLLLSLRKNKFVGRIPQLNNLELLYSLDLSENSFTGTIPDTLSNLTQLKAIYLSSNKLRGHIPDLGNLTGLAYLELQNNRLSLCRGLNYVGATLPNKRLAPDTCDLRNQFSTSCRCSSAYSNCQTDTTCYNCIEARPSADYDCIQGGVWGTTNGIVEDQQELVLEGPTKVEGDLTVVPGGVLILNPLASMDVSGCAEINGTLQLILDNEAVDRLSKTSGRAQSLIRALCGLSSDVPIDLKRSQKSCRSVSVEPIREGQEGGAVSLNAIFRVDSSKCNTWWIAVVSVIGILAVIGVAAAIIYKVHLKSRANSERTRLKTKTRSRD